MYVNVCKCNSSSNVPFLKNYKGLFSTLPDADIFFTPHSTKNSQTFKFRKKTEHWYKVEFPRVSGDFALEHCRTLQNNTEHYTSTYDNPLKITISKTLTLPDRHDIIRNNRERRKFLQRMLNVLFWLSLAAASFGLSAYGWRGLFPII